MSKTNNINSKIDSLWESVRNNLNDLGKNSSYDKIEENLQSIIKLEKELEDTKSNKSKDLINSITVDALIRINSIIRDIEESSYLEYIYIRSIYQNPDTENVEVIYSVLNHRGEIYKTTSCIIDYELLTFAED